MVALAEIKVFAEISTLLNGLRRRGFLRSKNLNNMHILVIPGFLSNSLYNIVLRRFLESNGAKTYSAKLRYGYNLSLDEKSLWLMEKQIRSILPKGEGLYIIGHSLGGMHGRALANRCALVKGVITLGSPYMINPFAQQPKLVQMIYEAVNGDKFIETFELLENIQTVDTATHSIWSIKDGVVNGQDCYNPQESNTEISCTHLGMTLNTAVYNEILLKLNDWHSCDSDAFLGDVKEDMEQTDYK